MQHIDIMNNSLEIQNIFNNNCTYEKVNSLNTVKMRNMENGITIKDAILYRLLYSKINTTKEEIVSIINDITNKSFTRHAFDNKENNISINVYKNILNDLISFYSKKCTDDKSIELKPIAVDGSSNNDKNQNIMLNMGYFDIKNRIPIDLTCYGSGNRNQEILMFKKYIIKNKNKFENVVFICDRFYYSFQLIKFLDDNDFCYIIRAKGDAKNIDKHSILQKNCKYYNMLINLREKTRVIKCNKSFEKIIYSNEGKTKKTKKFLIEFENDCNLVTNLIDNKKYSDETILNLYRSRWEIEVFFKLIKNNFKFQHVSEKDLGNFDKSIVCDMILVYISKIISFFYLEKLKPSLIINRRTGEKMECKLRINETLLMKNIFNRLLIDLIYNKSTTESLIRFCKLSIKQIKNELNRSFPRKSKTAFTKWYIKAYSISTKYAKIIDALENNKVYELDKNLKIIAKKIINYVIIT
jgi:hypothetical protein